MQEFENFDETIGGTIMEVYGIPSTVTVNQNVLKGGIFNQG